MSRPLGDNIVSAMRELKERRDAGEHVHMILQEVADERGVPVDALKQRAEASWGSPLEADRETHATHFEYVETKAQIEREARELARLIWDANKAAIEEFSWWRIDWHSEINKALSTANLNHPEIEDTARAAFIDEARRLHVLGKSGSI